MSEYSVYVIPEEFQAIKKLPGNVRQRVKHAIDELAHNPRPPNSQQLTTDQPQADEREARRVRINNWRVVCLVSEVEKASDMVAVQKRPPYDYGDLAHLLSGRT